MPVRMAPPGAAREGAIAAWGASRVRSGHDVLGLPSHPGAARTVRFTRRAAVLCRASGSRGGGEWDGRLVDEGMGTLRRRIREARAAAAAVSEEDSEQDEEDDDMGDPEWFRGEWTELDLERRRHHGSCHLAGVGVLRALLMRAPPGLLLALLLLLLSVPASVLLVSAQLIRAVDSISAAVLHAGM